MVDQGDIDPTHGPDPENAGAETDETTELGSEPGSLPGAKPPEIGPYRLIRQPGRGGMGVVYLARQTQPAQREVAIKLLSGELDSAQRVARFEAERRKCVRKAPYVVAREGKPCGRGWRSHFSSLRLGRCSGASSALPGLRGTSPLSSESSPGQIGQNAR